VTAGDTGAPIALALIILNPDEGHQSSYAHTDERGRFEIRNVTPGRYHVQVSPPEYRSRYLGRGFGGETLWSRGSGFDVGAGEVRDGIDVVLPLSAAVSGRVLDEAGEPLALVRVQTLRVRANGGTPEPVGSGLTQTDDLGRFRFFGLAEGEYLLEATPEPRHMRAKDSPPAFVETFYPSAVTSDGAVKVRLKAGQDTDGFDIMLARTKTFRISGTVLDPDGQPWGTATGSLTRLGGNGEELRIDPAGRFAAGGLAPGTYQISFSPLVNGRNAYGTARFTIADANIDDLVVTTSPAVDVRGRVVLEGDRPSNLSRFAVEVTQVDPDNQFDWIPEWVSVDADGSFLMRRLHGPSIIRARVPDDWHLKAVLLDDDDVTDKALEFRDRDSGHIQVVLTQRGSTVEGSVTDDRGNVVSDCMVLLFSANRADWIPSSSKWNQQSLGRNSRFRVTGVRPGKYLVAALAFERIAGMNITSAAVLESLASDATQVVLGVDEHVQVTLKLMASSGGTKRD
jgi:protocatechuate 3,4-dioxygenase beta subunit